MPTIPQLPLAATVSASDVIPISQGGSVHGASVGSLLLAAQPVITLQSPSLLGRHSLGSGVPEEIDVGPGISFSGGAIAADGSDHANYPSASSLAIGSDLVISDHGTQMLMPTELLRGIFSAGQNISIDGEGTISTTVTGGSSGGGTLTVPIGSMPLAAVLAGQDLVPISQAGVERAIAYSTFLNGITIDQTAPAGPASDSDMFWTGQSSSVMASQTFAGIWNWMIGKLPTYKSPVIEVIANISLNAPAHNGRIIVCSQPVTITPVSASMGSGFQCQVLNGSSGNVILAAGFITSTNTYTLAQYQTASISCLTYSGGTIVHATMPALAGASLAVPGQVTGLTSSSATAGSVSLTWQTPTTGGPPASYVLYYRQSGSTAWLVGAPSINGTGFQMSGLQPAVSYEFEVIASNATGTGLASPMLTVSTSPAAPPLSVPTQVLGVVANTITNYSITVSWSAQAGVNAAASYTVQVRTAGSTGWAVAASGLLATSYTLLGLQSNTTYDISVIGINASGAGAASSIVSTATAPSGNAVSSISWSLGPSGIYAQSSGTVGLNVHVTPSAAAVQFCFSTSALTPGTSWTIGLHINTDFWGAYVPTPSTAGTWYAWVQGTDGSCSTVFPTAFLVQ